MRIAIALASLLFLSACADGRWVAHDLSSYSFKFNSSAPSKPFAKARPATLTRASAAAPARTPWRSLAASTY